MSYTNPYQDPPRPYPGYNNDSTISLVDQGNQSQGHGPRLNTQNQGGSGPYQNLPNPGSLQSPPGAYPYANSTGAYTPTSLNDPGTDQFDMGYAGHLQGKGGGIDEDEEEEKAPLTAQYGHGYQQGGMYPPGGNLGS
jgi:hypothetical protein